VRTELRRLAFLVIVGALLAVAPGTAGAKAQETALSGVQTVAFEGDGARIWSAGPWTQFRNFTLAGSFTYDGPGVTLSGTLTRIVNVKIDVNGNGFLNGTDTYVDASTGVICEGVETGKLLNGSFFTGILTAPCSDGSLLKGNVQDTQLVLDNQGNLIGTVSQFTGVLRAPGK
jgi:hypothetical protein